MKKYKSIIIAFLFVAIHIFIILVLFKKPNIDQDKINKQNKQSNISEFKTGYENNKTMNENFYYVPSNESGHLRRNKKKRD